MKEFSAENHDAISEEMQMAAIRMGVSKGIPLNEFLAVCHSWVLAKIFDELGPEMALLCCKVAVVRLHGYAVLNDADSELYARGAIQ